MSRAMRGPVLLATLAAMAWCGTLAARGDMSGSVQVNVTATGSGSSYTCSTEQIQVTQITNYGSYASGELRLRVWYTDNNNFFTPGYPVASYTVGVLSAGGTSGSINQTVNCSQTPPNGDYCVTLALEDFTADAVDDYVKFAGCQHWPPNQSCTTGLSCTAGQYYTYSTGSTDSGYGSGGALDWHSLLMLAALALLAGARRSRALASP